MSSLKDFLGRQRMVEADRPDTSKREDRMEVRRGASASRRSDRLHTTEDEHYPSTSFDAYRHSKDRYRPLSVRGRETATKRGNFHSTRSMKPLASQNSRQKEEESGRFGFEENFRGRGRGGRDFMEQERGKGSSRGKERGRVGFQRGNERGRMGFQRRNQEAFSIQSERHPHVERVKEGNTSQNYSIGYKMLKSWSEISDTGEILLLMSNKADSLEELLMSDIKDDWFTLFVKSLITALECQLYPQKLKRILKVVVNSHLLTQILAAYIQQKQEKGRHWLEAADFILSILTIVQGIEKHLPDCVQKCKLPLILLKSFVKDDATLSTEQELVDAISNLLVSVMETHKNHIERLETRCRYKPTSDSESPPEDFRELSIVPTISDLFCDQEPFLRAVITKGAHRDQDHYLDIIFRLLREDFVKPLRKGIQDYIERGHEKNFKSSDIRIYQDVHFTGMVHNKGINHVVQFDVKNLKYVKWDHSKRLMNGNLLCLSNDNFQSTLIFATVSYRDVKFLKDGIINIICLSGLDQILKISSSDAFVMVETMAYYEAVHPVLRGLQTVDSDLPFKEYIISCEKKLKPPSYLLRGVYKYDISCLMKVPRQTEINVLNTLKWPPVETMCLNPSQRDAAIQALTKEISVIQGPPGTGKTYVGLKVMQVLVKNQKQMLKNKHSEYDPILVICYTNHALDQFLEGVLEFCPKGIIRVGGKCSKLLECFNLRNVRRDMRSESKAWGFSLRDLRGKMEDVSTEINEIKKQIDSLSTDILNEDILVNCISPKHYDDLKSGCLERRRRFKIHEWLNVSSKSFMDVLPAMIKQHMLKLIMQCLMIKDGKRELIWKNWNSVHIVDRVKLYGLWLAEYQHRLTSGIENSQRQGSMDISHLHYLYEQSRRRTILNDKELLRVVGLEVYQEVINCLGLKSSNFVDAECALEAWILGLHMSCSQQLDDVEKLKKFIDKFTHRTEEDVFDDHEESDNVKRYRLVDEDMDEEAKNFNDTLKVKEENSFLLTRAQLLGINEHDLEESTGEKNQESDDEFRTVTHKKKVTFSQVMRNLSNVKLHPFEEDKENSIENLWSLNPKYRFALYKLWIKRFKDILVSKIEILVAKYNELQEEINETRMKEDITALQKANVIGMTTTGAAKNRKLLEVIGCRIIIVEEAAEVLEAHIITALNKNCQHLILIGDHQQLRPNPTVYEHAKYYGLDVSLFERLVNNKIPHITLQEQHRMRESISEIMRHIYPKLQDHFTVKSYENIQGISKNVFFIQHNQEEQNVQDSLSKSNPYEAEYLIRLCDYLLNQGYTPSQITILATYAGQVFTIKKEMKAYKLVDGIRVTAVDNFQGEENDIILLSLVRSNAKNIVGFLKVSNRVCVALSRAKKGLFAIGNFKSLSSQSDLWKNIMQTAEEKEITGEGLPLHCPNHQDKTNVARIPKDFDNCPEGGCSKKCDFRLECGHMCPKRCHGYDLQHEKLECLAPCKKSCSEGHPCKRRCNQQCGDCFTKVDKTIASCGHTNKFDCYRMPQDTDCYSQCITVLPCGHPCAGKCGSCKANVKHKPCKVLVSYFWPCGHIVEVPCHYTPDNNPCPKICGETLNCGHKCQGKCSDCLNGAIHIACAEKCKKQLPCGHMCQSLCGILCTPCSLPCPAACKHGPCSHKNKLRKCGDECISCQEVCKNSCPHQQCPKKCFEECNLKICERECIKILQDCGHQCSGLCGQICVCKRCKDVSQLPISKGKEKEKQNEKKSHVVFKLPNCGHIFDLSVIDSYMITMDEKNSSEFICCPICPKVIQRCSRYDTILKQRTKRREEEKKNLLVLHELTTHQRKGIQDSLRLLQDKDKDLDWFDWRHLESNLKKIGGNFQTVSMKLKFAYAISEIQTLEQDATSSDSENDIKERISALLQTKDSMTSQQVEEYRFDLKRLLIFKYLNMLKEMAETHGISIAESISESWKDVLRTLKVTKPPAQAIDDGIGLMKTSEDVIKDSCSNSSVQALIMLKKKIACRALDVLIAEDGKILSKIHGDIASTASIPGPQYTRQRTITSLDNLLDDLMNER